MLQGQNKELIHEELIAIIKKILQVLKSVDQAKRALLNIDDDIKISWGIPVFFT